MVFKILDEDTERLSEKVQFLGKSFAEIERKGFKAWSNQIDIAVIEAYNKAVKDSVDVSGDLSEILKDTEGNTLNYTKATEDLIKSANGAAISQEAIASASNKVGFSAKAAAVGMQALNMAINAIIGIGISIALGAIVKGIDYVVHYSENLRAKVNELTISYNSLKSEAEAINKEMETNVDRIKQLLALESPTYVETAELEKLKELNEELRISLDLKERAVKKEQEKAEKTAVKAYGLEVNNLNPFTWETEGAASYIEDYIRSAEAVRNRIKEIESKTEQTTLEKSILPSLKAQYEGQEDFLIEYANTLDKFKDSLHDISPEAIRAKADISAVLNMVYDFANGIDVIPEKVKDVLNQFSFSFEKYSKEELITAGMGIEIDQEVFSGAEMAYRRLENIALSYGYATEDLIDICEHFGYIQKSVSNSIGNTEDAFADQINSIKDASSAYNLLMKEYNSTGEISYETYRKVIAGNSDLEKSFQNVNGTLKLDVNTLKEWISTKKTDVAQTMIMQGATREQVAEIYSMIDAIEESIEAYSNSMTIRNQFVEEFNQNGEISYETYQKLIQNGSEYADVVEKVNGKYTVNIDKLDNLDASTKKVLEDTLALYGATEKQINAATKLTPATEDLAQSYSEIVSELGTLTDWMDKVNQGYEFSAIEILNLIEKYPQLASSISATTNGYKLEAEALRDVINLKAQNLKLTAANSIEAASSVVLSKAKNQTTVDNAVAIALRDGVQSWEDYVNEWRNDWGYGEDMSPNVEGIQELVQAVINQKAIDKAVGLVVDDVLGGEYKQGYDPTKKTKKEETEFSKQLKQLKYEKEAFEAEMKIDDGVYDITSAEKYYTTLQNLATTALQNGEIDINEYREYILEAYKGLNEDAKVFENQLKQLQYEKNALDAKMKIPDAQYNLKSAEDYYRALEELSRIAYESNEIDVEQYRNYTLECYKNLMKAEEEYFNTMMETSEFKIYQLDREYAAEQKQIDAYINMQEMILDKKNEYIQKGYDLTSDEIRNLESAYESFGERIAEIMAGSVDQNLIEEYTGILDTLTQKRKWYLQNGYDETSTELRNLQKEYDNFADEIVSIMESAAQRIASAQKSAIDQVISSMKSATSAMDTVLNTVVDYIKREKDAEKSTLQDQINSLKSSYGEAKDIEKKYYDDLIKNEKESYSTRKKEADKYFKGLLDAAKKAYEAEKTHLSNLLSAYKRIIDAQKESLKTAQEVEKYKREVANKNKGISDMKNQLAILGNDDSIEARAKSLDLIEKIKKAEEDLNDYQNDYALNNTLTALDKEYQAYEDMIKGQQELLEQQYNSMKEMYEAQKEAHMEMLEANNKATLEALEAEKESKLAAMESQHETEVAALEQKIADIDEYLKKEGALRRDANALIEKEGQELWDKLMEYEYEYSKDITSLQEAWAIANGAMAEYGNGQFNILDTMREMNAQMDLLISKSNALANIDSYTATMKQNSIDWHKSDPTTQQNLHDQNVTMGNALGAEYKNGVWYLNGKPLYTFHSGAEEGFVLGDPILKSNEIFAKLAKGELVTTPNQLDRLGTSAYRAGIERMTQLQSQANDFSVGKVMEVNFNGNISKDDLPKINSTIKKATDTILDEIQKRNSRRGTKPRLRTY